MAGADPAKLFEGLVDVPYPDALPLVVGPPPVRVALFLVFRVSGGILLTLRVLFGTTSAPLATWLAGTGTFFTWIPESFQKHCQRHNGPEG